MDVRNYLIKQFLVFKHNLQYSYFIHRWNVTIWLCLYPAPGLHVENTPKKEYNNCFIWVINIYSSGGMTKIKKHYLKKLQFEVLVSTTDYV